MDLIPFNTLNREIISSDYLDTGEVYYVVPDKRR